MSVPLKIFKRKQKVRKFKPTRITKKNTNIILHNPIKKLEQIKTTSELIKDDIRRMIPNPCSEVYFISTIQHILIHRGIFIESKNVGKVTRKYFNEWKQEYENTVLAKEQAKLFEEAKNKCNNIK